MMGSMTGGSFSSWLVLLRDLSVKSALLLLAAWALTLATRRAAAATRHLAWLLTFAGLLLLPLLSVTLPARPVPVLPPPAVPAALPTPIALPPLAAEAPANTVPDQPPAPPLPARILTPPVLPPASPNWSLLLCRLWLLGVGLAALPLAAGLLLAAWRIRRCSPVTDPSTQALAAEAARQLGLRRPVILRSGPSVSVPVTFGLVRPVILLPDGAAFWPAERLRVALLHELAHIRRGDWATQTVARLVCALFWHNPLVWPAARMLRAEAERACDDLVLSSGVPAPDYAQHLLAVAAALAGANRPLPLAVPMAGRGPLESRLRAVLTARPRRAPSRRLAALAFLITLVVLVPLAVLHPAARAARRAAPPLTPAPIILPAPPEAARPSLAPIRASIAIPPVPALTKSTPIGVPTMKPLTPVKTVTLAALAATLVLPVAQAKPTAPVNLVAHSAVALPHMRLQAAPPNGSTLINFATQGDVTNGVAMLFQGSHRNYVIEPGVSGTVNVHLSGVPFDKALTTLLETSSKPLEYTIRGGIYHIQPRHDILIFGGPGDDIYAPNPLVSLDLKKVPIRQALDSLFTAAGANYTVASEVPGDSDIVTVHLTDVPLLQAMNAVLAASDTPLQGRVQEGGIFAVTLKHVFVTPFGNRLAPVRPGSAANPLGAPASAGISPVRPDAAKAP